MVVGTQWIAGFGVWEAHDLRCDGCYRDNIYGGEFVLSATNGVLGKCGSIDGLGFETGRVLWWE